MWQELLAALSACGDPPDIRHGGQPCARTARRRGKRGQQDSSHRPLPGRPTTKIHALADGQGRLYALMLTAGQVHDVIGGRALLARVPPSAG